MTTISFCIAILGVLALQGVRGQELPYDHAAYQSLLNLPPHFTPCNVAYTTFWEYSVYESLGEYASAYNLDMYYLSQWYALIQSTCPTISNTAINAMLDSYASHMQTLMKGRNIPFAPPALPCDPWNGPFYPSGSLSTLSTDAALNSDIALAYRNTYAAMDPLMSPLPYNSMSYFRDVATAHLPAECADQVNAVGNMIGTNIRYALGMAGRYSSSFYPEA